MKTRVIIIVIVALIPVYLGTTWLLAQAAQAHETAMWKKVEEQSQGTIKVITTKVDSHFFTASEDIRLQLNNPLFGGLLSTDKDHPSCAAELTLHNDITYGPLPKFRGFGIARIETTVQLPDEFRKKLIESIGTDKPLQFITTVGFTGQSHLEIVSSAWKIQPKDGNETGEWKGGSIRFNTSKSMDSGSFAGNFPGLVVKAKDNSTFNMDSISLDGTLQRKFEVLYTGEEMLRIGSIKFNNQQDDVSSHVSVNNISYGFKASADDQFLNIGIGMESGSAIIKSTNIKDAHFVFSSNHLDGKALAALYKVFNDIQTKAMKATCGNQNAQNTESTESNSTNTGTDAKDSKPDFEAIKQQSAAALLTLLQHAPIFSLDNISFATTDGALKLTGSATINGVAESDLTPEVQYQSLIGKLSAHAEFNIDQALVDHWPIKENAEQFKQQVAALETQGFLTRKGNALQSHLEFKNGKLTANGKPIGGGG